MKWLYLIINFCTILVPFIFSFHAKLKFNKHFKSFFIANFAAGFIFVLWDMLYTQWGVWGFNPNYILGGYLYNLPFEEVLFFVCIPFSCVFTYHCLNIFYKFTWRPRTEQWVVIGLCSILLALGVYSFPKLYTSATFISLSFFLLFLKFKAKVNWLPKLVLIYPVLLIPFFIVNGILTGTGIDSPVVWYNDHENMGLRLFTIPIEDIFYGFELILLNIYIYEYLKGEEGGS